MAKEDPYAVNKLICDATPGMSERDIDKAARARRGGQSNKVEQRAVASLKRAGKEAPEFDLDDYVRKAMGRDHETLVVKKGVVARVGPSAAEEQLTALRAAEEAPLLVLEEDAVPESERCAQREERARLREAAVAKYTRPLPTLVGDAMQGEAAGPTGILLLTATGGSEAEAELGNGGATAEGGHAQGGRHEFVRAPRAESLHGGGGLRNGRSTAQLGAVSRHGAAGGGRKRMRMGEEGRKRPKGAEGTSQRLNQGPPNRQLLSFGDDDDDHVADAGV